MNTLLSLSVAILAGLMMTRVFKPLRLPSVTSYLIAGVLVGPYCLGLLGIDGLGFTSFANVEKLSLVSDVALGFIAFSIPAVRPEANRPGGHGHRHFPGAGGGGAHRHRASDLLRPVPG